MEKKFYENRAYESVDDRSSSWVASQIWTEHKIQAVKGYDPSCYGIITLLFIVNCAKTCA